MKDFCICVIAILWTIFAFFVGAVSHEADLSRNFAKNGDALSWFYEIKIEQPTTYKGQNSVEKE
jgi:hypothetical protein